jgi:hypothetical protein
MSLLQYCTAYQEENFVERHDKKRDSRREILHGKNAAERDKTWDETLKEKLH